MVRQISVDQGTGGADYPLVRPSQLLGLLLADLFLVYREDLCQFTAPFRISHLSGFGTGTAEDADGPNLRDIVIVDANDDVVFDSATAELVESAWGSDKSVVEWAYPDEGTLCRVVYFTDSLADWPSSFEPESAVLNPRVTQKRSSAVDTIVLETEDGDYTIQSDEVVELAAGYNIQHTYEVPAVDDGGERTSRITVDCIPGAGLGKYPGCDPTPILRRLASVTPRETGDISLNSLQCFRTELVPTASGADTVTVTPGTLRISTSCGPCAKCDQFAAVYESYRRLHLKYKALGRRSEAVRDQRKANIVRWNTSMDCRRSTSLRLTVIPIGACRAVIGGSICNNTDGPIRDVGLRFLIDGEAVDVCLLCRTVRRRGNRVVGSKIGPNQWLPYSLGVVDGGYSGGFDCIDPGAQGIIAFHVFFDGATHGQEVSVTLEAIDYDVPSVSMDATLNCERSYDPSCCESAGTTTPEA